VPPGISACRYIQSTVHHFCVVHIAALLLTVWFELVIFTSRSKLRKVLFLVPSVTFSFFLFVHQISRGNNEQNCTKFTGKMCFVPRLDEFECESQRSGSLGTNFLSIEKCIVMHSLQITLCSSRRNHSITAGGDGSAQRLPACSMCLIKHLCCSFF